MRTINRSKFRWAAIVAVAVALALGSYAAVAGIPTGGDAVQQGDTPIPVEPDGGIGDTPTPGEPVG